MGWNDRLDDPDKWESFLEAALGIWDDRDKTVPPTAPAEDDECDCDGCA